MQFNVLLPPSTLNPAQMTNVLKQISDVSGAEIVFKSMCFEMHGLEHEVRAAVAMILELDAIKVRYSVCTCLYIRKVSYYIGFGFGRHSIMRYGSKSS